VTESRRFLLLLVSGLLLFAGLSTVAIKATEPTPAAAADSPLLHAGDVPTTLSPTTQVPDAPETTVPPTEPVVPPKDAYAPEPIQEIGTIEIPKIGLRHRVMHGISLRNIDHGPSHWPGTPLPGENGNTVFAGHRVTHSHPFRNIDQLVPGDEIFFTVAGVRSRYVVTGHEVVAPTRLDIVKNTPTPIATLFACHPPGSARQRYVVRAALAVD
jgi:sortase A